ncbi:MAG: M20/M25/M40 family metallo-hydrolase [Planctomycetota bacterium]|jgi:acetylornithine deacetylase/succinyl-diaminopimelate desuccinylase-like protein
MTQTAPTPEPAALEQGQRDALEHLKTLLRFDTQNPPGNEHRAIAYIRKTLEAAGIPCKVFEPGEGRQNLVARLRGNGSKEPLLLTSHVDVVHVEPDKWRYPPFCGEEHEGCIWGRGALDMKGMTAQQLACVLQLKREGHTLQRDVILLCLADEEAGMEYGSTWMVENEPDSIRAEYALNEIGGFTVHVGDQRLYPIQTAEKGHLWLELTASGDPGHGSIPHNSNAVSRIARAITKLSAAPLRHRVHPAARGFLLEAAAATGGVGSLVLKGLLRKATSRASLAALSRLDSERAAFFKALLHDCVTPTGLRAGVKENVIPSEASAVIDGRYLPGTSAEEFMRLVRDRVGEGVDLRVISRGDPSEVPASGPFFDLIGKTLEAHDPGAKACSWLAVGYTDSANLSRLGIKCYGCYPVKLPKDLNFGKLIHGHNERVPVEGFTWGYRVMWDIVSRWVCQA